MYCKLFSYLDNIHKNNISRNLFYYFESSMKNAFTKKGFAIICQKNKQEIVYTNSFFVKRRSDYETQHRYT